MISRAVLFETFVGRAEEIAYLERVRDTSGRTATGAIVSVIGEAGVGKSRLLSEFARASLAERGAFIRIRCEELPIAYAPLVQTLKSIANLGALRRSGAVVAALEELQSTLTTSTGEAVIDAGGRKYDIFRRIALTLGMAAQRLGQLTIVVDDLHWSDISTLEALRILAREIGPYPLFLVLAYRPDDLAADHARSLAVSAIEREGVDRLTLGRLAFGDVAELLKKPVPGANNATVRRIYDLSEGRPFVIEELARSVAERGSALELEGTLSLRSVVLERFERLSIAHRDIVERAAVLGRNFTPDDLAALGTPQAELVAALRAGLDLQLFEEREVNGAPWFRFRHALTREILYRNIMTLERRALHLAIAERLAASERRVSEYAYHLAAAGEATRAAHANELAGDAAVGVLAFADAAKLFERALEFTTDDDARARIGIKRTWALRRSDNNEGLVEITGDFAERLATAGYEVDAIRILVAAMPGIISYDIPTGLARVERMNALIDRATPPDVRFEAAIASAYTLRMSGRNDEAIEACDRAERCLASPTASQKNALLHQQAVCAFIAGDVSRALAILEDRMNVHRGTGTIEEIWTTVALACVFRSAGRTRESFDQFCRAAELSERAGHDGEANMHRCNAAGVAAERGDFAFVTDVARRVRRDGAMHYHFLDMALTHMTRAIGGDPEPFVELFEASLDSKKPFLIESLATDVAHLLDGARARSRSIAMRGLEACGEADVGLLGTILEFGNDEDVATAVRLFRESEPHPEKLRDSMYRALFEARLARRENRPIEARHHAERAIGFARSVEDWLDLESAYELAGDIAAARAELARVGATAELARFNRRHPVREETIAAPAARLTRREEQIVRAYADGSSSREVGERLSITPRTVEAHLKNVYQKFGINSRSELAELIAGFG